MKPATLREITSNLLDQAKQSGGSAVCLGFFHGNDKYSCAMGRTLLEGSSVEVSSNSRFHIGSCTKALSASLFHQIAADRLDTPLKNIFDEKVSLHPSWNEVTPRHLLDHYSGVKDDGQLYKFDSTWDWLSIVYTQIFKSLHEAVDRIWAPHQNAEREQVLMQILSQPTSEKIGSSWSYSNLGYAIASLILEKEKNKTYEELMKSELFSGAPSAGFGQPSGLADPRGHPLASSPAGTVPPVITAAGDCHVSIEDFLTLLQLEAERSATVTDPHFGDIFPWLAPGVGYAAGWFVMDGRAAPSFFNQNGKLIKSLQSRASSKNEKMGRVLLHSGSDSRWSAFALIDKENKLGFAGIANVGGVKVALGIQNALDRIIKELEN